MPLASTSVAVGVSTIRRTTPEHEGQRRTVPGARVYARIWATTLTVWQWAHWPGPPSSRPP